MKKTGKRKALGVGRFLILAFFLALVVLPIYWMTITSFKTIISPFVLKDVMVIQ